MFDFGSILASVFTGLQDAFLAGIVEWITAVLGGFLPIG